MPIKVYWSNQEIVNEITHPTVVSYESHTDWPAIHPDLPYYNTKPDSGSAVGHSGELQVQEKTEKLSVPYTIHKNDVISFARAYRGEPFHALLSDPPYHLTSTVKRFGGKNAAPAQQGTDGAFARASRGFMGKTWDGGEIAFDPETWCAFLELLHPGAFGMAFASSRGWHRMACAIEDAGFIIHPSIFGWGFGSGFPKATRIDTQIDKMEGNKREKILVPTKNGNLVEQTGPISLGASGFTDISKSISPKASMWENHRYGGQALKPALEPIIVFQRPYEGKPIDSILKTGAGALGIMNAKIGSEALTYGPSNPRDGSTIYGAIKAADYEKTTEGRWPANLVLGHSPECRDGKCTPYCAVFKLGEQSGSSKSKRAEMSLDKSGDKIYGKFNPTDEKSTRGHTDEGTAARFFFNADWNAEVEETLYNADPVRYCPKSSTSEREAGLEEFKTHSAAELTGRKEGSAGLDGNSDLGYDHNPLAHTTTDRRNVHPTVKPISLTEHLARLLLPPVEYAPRRILIPFSGVSSEMIGACRAGWDFVCGIENEQEYVDIGNARLKYHVDR